MLKVLMQNQRAPLPPEGTWTYEEQQLWALVGQSWAENPEERYEIRKIKNFLKDLVCDKTPEGPPGGSPSPSPETDSAIEAARDLDRVRIWLDGELYGHSTSLVEGFQDWDSSGSYSQQRNSFLSSSRLIFTFADYFGDMDSDGRSTTTIYALLHHAPLPDDSVPHSESIQEHLWLDGELYWHSTSLVEGFQDWDSNGSYSQQRNSFLSSSR